MIKSIISPYLPRSYTATLVYMLQRSEYQPNSYLSWVWKTTDFTRVMKRATLDKTKAARLLLLFLRIGIIAQILLGILIAYLGIHHKIFGGLYFGLAIIIIYPFTWAYLLVLPLLAGKYLINTPLARKQILASSKTFAKHPGVTIAVAGSYGKTTMKELLLTVLSEGLDVAATPANKNVSISHANFAKRLSGKEDVLIIEYGEGEPGDVERFSKLTHPSHAVITGIAPAHLDKYKTLQAAAEDIFSVASYLKGKNIYVNIDSKETKPYFKKTYHSFSIKGALGWKVSEVKTDINGLSFTMKKANQTLKLSSQLIGKHQVGYLAFVAALALELGLSKQQVVSGISKTKPFEHRLKPYLLNSAWVVDDTYNGNLEGIRAGTSLLKDLKAKRKIYVTPGLVDQGEHTSKIHEEVGELIAAAKPDQVVLMKNSVTDYIEAGLKKAHYKGDLEIKSDPLEYYTNLSHYLASGDVVLMQNDWPDNYS